MACWIRAGGGCVRVGETVWNILKGGGTEKAWGEAEILKRGGCKLGQGVWTLKGVGAGTPLQIMLTSNRLHMLYMLLICCSCFMLHQPLKVLSVTFVLVCFLSLNESTFQTRRNVFISLQKLFSLSRKSNFRILHFQISWCHQMPKHKTRNTFHWITWEVNAVC